MRLANGIVLLKLSIVDVGLGKIETWQKLIIEGVELHIGTMSQSTKESDRFFKESQLFLVVATAPKNVKLTPPPNVSSQEIAIGIDNCLPFGRTRTIGFTGPHIAHLVRRLQQVETVEEAWRILGRYRDFLARFRVG